jgi:hypothetical protein
MTKEGYWKIFLKTDDKWKGFSWKKKAYSGFYEKVDQMNLDSYNVPPKSEKVIYKINCKDISQCDKVSIIQVKFENKFKSSDD